MAIKHRCYPIFGVQFHPEAILTEHGYDLLANFLRLAGLEPADPQPALSDELQIVTVSEPAEPAPPYTF